jgi:hypothetical protein
MSDQEKILSALREKPLKVYEIMKRANVPNEESCQSLLLKNAKRRFGEIRYPQWAMVSRITVETLIRGLRNNFTIPIEFIPPRSQ